MNPLYQSLVQLQRRLTAAGIASAVIGGIAVSVWARPRATQDIDFKVLLDRDAAQRLLNILTPDYIPLQANPLQALQRNGVLFVKNEAGIRIDLQLADTRLDESAIQRAQTIELEPGVTAQVCSAEDLIIYKLWYYSLSQQTKHLRDITSIVLTLDDQLDYLYIEHWINKKGLTNL